MPTFLEQLAAGTAKTFAEVARGSSSLGKLLQREGVPHTPELDRVLALPRRVWETDAETAELVRLLTKELRAPGSTRTLYPHQAVLLRDAYEHGGAVGGLKVGEGKTDVSYVAPTLLGAKRPVLLIPADLRPKTERHFAELARYWRKPPPITVIGYQELGLKHNAELLDKAKPDLIVADEVYKLKNREAAVTRRVERYLAAHEGTKLIIMSGTLPQECEIPEYQHLLRWCLVQGMPLPMSGQEALVWSRALDREVPLSARMSPGALQALVGPEDVDAPEPLRAAFERRMRETPGVVMTREVDVGSSLQIAPATVPVSQIVREAITSVWAGKTPAGREIEQDDAPHYIGQAALGFTYEPDQPAPLAWKEAKKKWTQIERLILDSHQDGLDSPEQVQIAVALGKLGRIKEWERWSAIRDTYRPVIYPHWVTYEIIDEIAKLAKQLGPDIIVWTHYWAPGEALRERHGFRFFRHRGVDEQGMIEDATGTIVASISSCAEGHNLQHHYHKNLVITPPSEQALWEQFIGRTHRKGQRADIVYCWALAHVPTYQATLEKLRANATGKSRLAIADWV